MTRHGKSFTPFLSAAVLALCALALGLRLHPAAAQDPENQGLTARPLASGLQEVRVQPVRPQAVQPVTLDPNLLQAVRQGRDSAGAPGEKQRDPKVERAQGETMPAVRLIKEADRKPAFEVDPKLRDRLRERLPQPDMAAELAAWERQGQLSVRGELRPFEEVRQLDPRSRPEPPRPDLAAVRREMVAASLERGELARGRNHLKLVLKLRKDGTTEVVSATELPGGAAVSETVSSDFVYELAVGGETLAVESLAGDPFEYHSFGTSEDAEQGHYIASADEAEIVVQAPDVRFDASLDRLSFNLYKLREGPVPARLDAAELRKLKSEQKLEAITRAAGAELAPKIREMRIQLRNDG